MSWVRFPSPAPTKRLAGKAFRRSAADLAFPTFPDGLTSERRRRPSGSEQHGPDEDDEHRSYDSGDAASWFLSAVPPACLSEIRARERTRDPQKGREHEPEGPLLP